MKRSKILKAPAVTAALPLRYLADTAPDASPGLTLIRDAQAIVGAPLTPVSVAGVARRTTRRVVVAESTAVAATTASTSAMAQQQAATAQQPEAKSGVEVQNCGGVFYRAAFQGNNLVYVVQ